MREYFSSPELPANRRTGDSNIWSLEEPRNLGPYSSEGEDWSWITGAEALSPNKRSEALAVRGPA